MGSEDIAKHQFRTGSSGNPNGRPRGRQNLSTVLQRLLRKIAPDEVVDAKFIQVFCSGKKRVTYADALAARLMKLALVDGDLAAIHEIIDRTEGKSRQSVELNGGEPVNFTYRVTYVNDLDGTDYKPDSDPYNAEFEN